MRTIITFLIALSLTIGSGVLFYSYATYGDESDDGIASVEEGNQGFRLTYDIENTTLPEGEEVVIPITLENENNIAVVGLEIYLQYDDEVIQVKRFENLNLFSVYTNTTVGNGNATLIAASATPLTQQQMIIGELVVERMQSGDTSIELVTDNEEKVPIVSDAIENIYTLNSSKITLE